MAKLSARNRTCLVEVSREYDAATLQTAHDRYKLSYEPTYVAGSDPALTMWERKTLRLMSNRTILEKLDVRFQPDWLDKHGRRHSYGWKVRGKLKPNLTPVDFARIYAEPKRDGTPSAWTITQGAATSNLPESVVISQRRIRQAIESDESIGFCISCGSEQSGVEPDAEGYRCESCGQFSVKGAENLLLEQLS